MVFLTAGGAGRVQEAIGHLLIDPAGARSGDLYFQALGGIWVSSASPSSNPEDMVPIPAGGCYVVDMQDLKALARDRLWP